MSAESSHLSLAMSAESMGDLVTSKSVIIMTGPGGVGKTSSAAALAVGAAMLGINTCVVTIDPAKRLADALGIETIGNAPVQINTFGTGNLYAVMLDADATFDDLIVHYASTPDQAAKILKNKVYQNLTKNLSGIQEYMAMEKLFELHNDPRFGLLIVDTPPSSNALDFLDAPRKLIGFLDNKVFRLIMNPGPAFLRPVSFAARAVLKTISRVIGSEVVDEAVAFFQDFEGMEEGFRTRAESVQALMHQDDTAFVLVTAPRGDTVKETADFGIRLGGFGFSVAGLISNRHTPNFKSLPDSLGEIITQLGETDRQLLVENHTLMDQLRRSEESELGTILDELKPPRVVRIPMLSRDIADIEDLAKMAKYLL